MRWWILYFCVFQEAYSVARQFNLIPPIVEQAEYHLFQREKVELQMPELFHKIGKLAERYYLQGRWLVSSNSISLICGSRVNSKIICCLQFWSYICKSHYNDIIISVMASQITTLTIVYSTVYSGADQRKHQSSASLAFVKGIHQWPVNSPHKGKAENVSILWHHHVTFGRDKPSHMT